MNAFLIHGMGRTSLSMQLMAYRLTKAGFNSYCFSYSVTFERFGPCLNRLESFIDNRMADEQYFIVTHSLGGVLALSVLPRLKRKPMACFFLAPPMEVCAAARNLSKWSWYKVLTGEMGQLLADELFMSSLAAPDVPVKIYAGNSGFTGIFSPFGAEPNDGILRVKETQLANTDHEVVPSLHTFIMNNPKIADDIIHLIKYDDYLGRMRS